MKSLWISLAAAFLLASPVAGQDPVVVDAAHHSVVLENEYVRVLKITLGPGEKTPLHAHPAGVAVFLNDVHNRVSPDGAEPNETPRKKGDVALINASRHTVLNLGAAPSQVMLVEIKSAPAAAKMERDALQVDPAHYTLLGENDLVRVIRIRYGAGERSVMHDHPAGVAVFLSSGEFRMHFPDGTSGEPTAAEAGTAMFAPAETHEPENVGSTATELVLVELKGR